jgi:ribosomal protein S18 acetylase RimI-like enzyme
MAIEIREASEDEWEAVRDLRLRALREDPEAYGSTFERESLRTEGEWRARLSDAARATFVADADGRLAGTAVAAPWEEVGGPLGLFGMWVDPACRGRGIGARLVHRVLAHARERGESLVQLEVAEPQAAARRLYERCGFVDTGERMKIRDSEERPTGIVMSRRP